MTTPDDTTGKRGNDMSEIDYSDYPVEQLRHFLKVRDRQAVMSREHWVRAAKAALAGDVRELAARVELAEMGPVTITNGDTEYTFPAPPRSTP